MLAQQSDAFRALQPVIRLEGASDTLGNPPASPDQAPAQPKSWRDKFKIHPAAGLFPMMGAAELRELGEDIRKNDLSTTICMIEVDGEVQLLDGRNRLDAMELVGILRASNEGCPLTYRGPRGGLHAVPYYIFNSEGKDRCDPYKFVVSANIHRRHLKPEQKRDLI